MNPAITGLGVRTAIGAGRRAFTAALMAGEHRFGRLTRPGRARDGGAAFMGAELDPLPDESLSAAHRALLRRASWSAAVTLHTALEAWADAGLADADVDPRRVGLVIGADNVQQRAQWQLWARHGHQPAFVTPTYGLTMWDTDLVGLVSDALGSQGEGCTVGGASASGAFAILHAARQIRCGVADVCVAIGAPFDLSSWEARSLENLGAMATPDAHADPGAACRPFDRDAAGFVFGEGCGALVIERPEHARARGRAPYGTLLGEAAVMAGHRGGRPDRAAEARVMGQALERAGVSPAAVRYVNPHGTGARLGDRAELDALTDAGLGHCALNATKALTGHGLTAAGAVEAVATVLQLWHGRLHPTRNLDHPIAPGWDWVGPSGRAAELDVALSNSFAFAGLNTSLVFGSAGRAPGSTP